MRHFRGLGLAALLAGASLSLIGCHGYSIATETTYVNEKDGKQSLELRVNKAAAKRVSSGYAAPLHGEFVLRNAEGQVAGTYEVREKEFVLKRSDGKESKFSVQSDEVVKDESGQNWKRTRFEALTGLARNRS
jgi:hypothetical protein